VHSVVTSAVTGPLCHSSVVLHFHLEEPLFSPSDFVYCGPPLPDETRKRFGVGERALNVALQFHLLRVDRFTARKREIWRRLIGAEAFDLLIGSLTAVTGVVTPRDPPFSELWSCMREAHDARMTTQELPLGTPVLVFPSLTWSVIAFREGLQPRALRRLIGMDKLKEQWKSWGLQWMWGCYSSTVLAPTADCVSTAHITVSLEGRGLNFCGDHTFVEREYDDRGPSHCLNALLKRLPSLTSLHLSTTNLLDDPENEQLVDCKSLLDTLPHLRHLSVDNLFLKWFAAIEPLLSTLSPPCTSAVAASAPGWTGTGV
jgi:hypothetical protein